MGGKPLETGKAESPKRPGSPPLRPFALEPVRVPRPGRPWTVADLAELPDDGNRYELVRGDLLKMTPASPVQGRLASRLIVALGAYVDEHDLGETYTAEPGFRLQPEPNAVVRVPELAFVRRERIPLPEAETGFWPIAPDLAVEIISPSESAIEIDAKVEDYLTAGVRLVWLVFPLTQSVTEYRGDRQIRKLGRQDSHLGSLEGGEVVPGFRYALTSLFR